MEPALLLEVNGRSDHRCHGDDHQQSADQLLLQLLHAAASALYTSPFVPYSTLVTSPATRFLTDITAVVRRLQAHLQFSGLRSTGKCSGNNEHLRFSPS